MFFATEPTSSHDPQFGLVFSTDLDHALYTDVVSFSPPIKLYNLKGKNIRLFGKDYLISSSSNKDSLRLLESGARRNLTSQAYSTSLAIGGRRSYAISLIAASDVSATIKVVSSTGTEMKEVNEGSMKSISGLIVGVVEADEYNSKLTVEIEVGTNVITMPTSKEAVLSGVNGRVIEGTRSSAVGGNGEIIEIGINISAPNLDNDALLPTDTGFGKAFVDPVFGTFRVELRNFSSQGSKEREDIIVRYTGSGYSALSVNFTDRRGYNKDVMFAKSHDGINIELQRDEEGHNITVLENRNISRGDYVVVGNQDEGHLLRLSQITNSTSGTGEYANDRVTFVDVFSEETIGATLTADGVGTINVGGKIYGVTYSGASTNSDGIKVRLDYPDSVGSAAAVLYPTMRTSKGALIGFYEPLTIQFTDWDGRKNILNTMRLPNGDGYSNITITPVHQVRVAQEGNWTIESNGGTRILNTLVRLGDRSSYGSVDVQVGSLVYRFMSNGVVNQTTLYLVPERGSVINNRLALVIFEEKGDWGNHEALVVSSVSSPGSIRTTATGSRHAGFEVPSDPSKIREADKWGAIITHDSAEVRFVPTTVRTTISYPDKQVYGNIYVY